MKNTIKPYYRESISFIFLILLVYSLFSNINIYEMISLSFLQLFIFLITTFILDGLSKDYIIRNLKNDYFI